MVADVGLAEVKEQRTPGGVDTCKQLLSLCMWTVFTVQSVHGFFVVIPWPEHCYHSRTISHNVRCTDVIWFSRKIHATFWVPFVWRWSDLLVVRRRPSQPQIAGTATDPCPVPNYYCLVTDCQNKMSFLLPRSGYLIAWFKCSRTIVGGGLA